MINDKLFSFVLNIIMESQFVVQNTNVIIYKIRFLKNKNIVGIKKNKQYDENPMLKIFKPKKKNLSEINLLNLI
jgi:hypothetical protein